MKYKIIIIILIVLTLNSCQKIKDESKEAQTTEKKLIVPDNFFAELPVPGVADKKIANSKGFTTENSNNLVDSTDLNNGDEPVILGNQIPNPYTVSNMQAAYNMLYGPSQTLIANFLYVKFKPADADQLEILEDNSDLELQDYPMDYEVIQEGDYYQEPSIGTEDIPWLYTVVPVGYVPPPGIQYAVISELYLPNDDLLLEDMAESMGASAEYSFTISGNERVITREDASAKPVIIINRPPTPCNVSPCEPHCPYDPENPCGGTGGGTPAPDARIPRGLIQVQDVLNCTIAATNVPLRQARVVCKRWFKIWRGYTGDDGRFVCGRKFRNKVKVIVKTKNSFAKIGKVRGIRLWQLLFPVKKKIGVFDQGAMANIDFLFTKPTDGSASNKQLPYWAAATTHNSVIEFRQYSTEFGLGLPPENLKIFVTNWGFARSTGSTVMFNKCNSIGVPVAWIGYFIATTSIGGSIAGGLTAVGVILKNKVDMTISYLAANGEYNCGLSSAGIKRIVYHELGHAQHYQQVGCNFWTSLRNAEIDELVSSGMSDPYGDGTSSNAPIIATGEMWGSHCEYIYMNRHYGNGGAASAVFTAPLQGANYPNNFIPGLNCNLSAIESHNPNLNDISIDPWDWIPQGLPYDLTDPTGEIFPVLDNVSAFTNQQNFSALQSDVRSIQLFRNRLLLQNANMQQVQVNELFTQYGY